MIELTGEALETLKQGAQYAIFVGETGERVTPWITPDENGELAFDFSDTVRDYEIGMLLPDGTLLLGEPTHIETTD